MLHIIRRVAQRIVQGWLRSGCQKVKGGRVAVKTVLGKMVYRQSDMDKMVAIFCIDFKSIECSLY